MAIVDEQGKLFGRLNLLDALVVLLVVGLIPLGYGAYALFRSPMPTLTRVAPAEIIHAPNMRFSVRGENLRPYMRVSVGSHQGQTFLFRDTSEAEIDLVDVPPGVYDVVLFDFAQERSRLPKALTIHPSALPDAKVIVVGMFGNLKAGQTASLTVGMTIPQVGEVIAVGRPVPQVARVFARSDRVEVPIPNGLMVPAIIRMGCWVRASRGQPECVADGTGLHPTTLMFLPTPAGTLPFQIDQVRGTQPIVPLDITVRFTGALEALAQLKAGDVDRGEVTNELSAGGTVASVAAAGPSSRDARIVVSAQQGTSGWIYANSPLRIGGPFTLRTPLYELQGTVVRLVPAPGSAR